MKEIPIKELLASSDPLSDGAKRILLNYNKSETIHIEIKVAFEINSDEQWLKITKDFLAFANTEGGYILFGIEDGTFARIGMDEKTCSFLADPNNIHQKINRFIQPHIKTLTVAPVKESTKNFIFVHIPESKGQTHIVEKEGKFKYPPVEGKPVKSKIIIRPGEIYIRRSGGTGIIQPDDLQKIIERRINHYKEFLLNNITKVIQAPTGSHVHVLDPKGDANSQKIRLTSDEDATPVSGLPTTIVPKTDIQELVTAIALFKKDRENLPTERLLYRLYLNRDKNEIYKEYLGDLVSICLLLDVPCFYWMQFIKKEELESILIKLLERGNFFHKYLALKLYAFISRKKAENLVKRYFSSEEKKRLWKTPQKIHSERLKNLFIASPLLPQDKTELENEADSLAKSLAEKLHNLNCTHLWGIDCELYSEDFTEKA